MITAYAVVFQSGAIALRFTEEQARQLFDTDTALAAAVGPHYDKPVRITQLVEVGEG